MTIRTILLFLIMLSPHGKSASLMFPDQNPVDDKNLISLDGISYQNSKNWYVWISGNLVNNKAQFGQLYKKNGYKMIQVNKDSIILERIKNNKQIPLKIGDSIRLQE